MDLQEKQKIAQVISDGTLVPLTLLIAESKPEEQETMVKLTTNLLGL